MAKQLKRRVNKNQGPLEALRSKVASFLLPAVKNAMSLPAQFLKYGSGNGMSPNWTDVMMSDKDWYTGYGYAAIRKRANMVARVALANVRTHSEKDDLVHPYLETISKSKTFSDYKFWSDISTFLDLEGVYYLMAIRAKEGERTGNVKEFKMLSPYHVRRVIKPGTLEVSGYVETRMGFIREIPKEMIIEIRELNPFNENEPYAITDAAKESQFTLKTSSDFTRNALKHNINAPGILSTDVILDEEEFANFRQRVRDHVKGEPIFGNGAGALTWENMQTELSKAALKDVNDMNRDEMFSVTGVSKTMMGIEQSGTTRDTARVQEGLMTSGEILPRIQLVIDALNQDYKNSYPAQFEVTQAEIVVDNPLARDLDASVKEMELKTKQLELKKTLINAGVDPDVASQYVMGDVDIDMIDVEKTVPIIPVADKPVETKPTEEKIDSEELIKNEVRKHNNSIIQQQEGSLKNEIVNIDEQIVSVMLNSFTRAVKKINAQGDEPIVTLNSEDDLISKSERKKQTKDLAFVLAGFYALVALLKGEETMRDRMGEFVMLGDFTVDKAVKDHIKTLSAKVATSHVDTVIKDIYKTASEAALAGKSLTQIESLITDKYASVVVGTRATAIARSETNRAFTMAQFEADTQFLKQNELESRAYKKWTTRSDIPCAFCLQLASEPPIPFDNNFRNLGMHVEADGKSLPIDFEPLQAGNAHTNCNCVYILIIK